MSDGKFMRTLRSFLEVIGVPRKVAQGVKYNYIRRFLPTLGEVLRVDTRKRSRSAIGSKLQKGEIVGKPVLIIPHPGITLVIN